MIKLHNILNTAIHEGWQLTEIEDNFLAIGKDHRLEIEFTVPNRRLDGEIQYPATFKVYELKNGNPICTEYKVTDQNHLSQILKL